MTRWQAVSPGAWRAGQPRQDRQCCLECTWAQSSSGSVPVWTASCPPQATSAWENQVLAGERPGLSVSQSLGRENE
jgi:hypothetical protein